MRSSYTQQVYETLKEITLLLIIVFLVRTFCFGLYQVPSGSMETTMLVGERFLGEKISYFFRKPKSGEIVALNAPTYPYSSNKIVRLFEEYVWGPENWTKRVIGIPGDHVQGVIENGRPVIYRNGEKLNESYVNTYPLVYALAHNQDAVRAQVLEDIAQILPLESYDQEVVDRIVGHMMKEHAVPKSYDPACSIDKQPFYSMQESALLKDAQGNICYEGPQVPLENHGVEVHAKNKEHIFNGTDEFDVQLGQDEYWLMGDNRLGSTDSRYYGPIEERLIHGRIVFRIWSIDSNASWWMLDLVRDPVAFWSHIRWNRFFQII